MKTKDEVSNCFREFKVLMENVTGKKIKVLRSDNGGEYIDKTSQIYVRRKASRENGQPYIIHSRMV